MISNQIERRKSQKTIIFTIDAKDLIITLMTVFTRNSNLINVIVLIIFKKCVDSRKKKLRKKRRKNMKKIIEMSFNDQNK
jgi:hypothetical protein